MKTIIRPSTVTSQTGGRIIPANTPIQKAVATSPQSLYFSLKKATSFCDILHYTPDKKKCYILKINKHSLRGIENEEKNHYNKT